MLFDQRVEDLLTVGEEAVQRGRGDAGALGDGTRGDGFDAAFLDEGGRGGEDPLDGLAAPGLDRLSTSSTRLGRAQPDTRRFRGICALGHFYHGETIT